MAEIPQSREKNRRRLRTAAFSVGSAVVLCAVKLVVGVLSGSLGVLSSAFDSLADILMSAVNLFSIRASMVPPDKKHPYGHGKLETLAALFQATVIGFTGAWVVREGVLRLQAGRVPSSADTGIAVMLCGTVASAYVSRHIRKAGEETGSPALVADSVHFATDVWSNGGILVALVLFRFTGWKWIDPGVAVLVGLYILVAAGRILLEALQDLMDRTLPDETVGRIREVIESHRPVVVDYHDLRTRRSGSEVQVDFHLVLCRDLSLEDAHRVADHVEDEVRRLLGGGGSVISHIDPCRIVCDRDAPCVRGVDARAVREMEGPETRETDAAGRPGTTGEGSREEGAGSPLTH